MSAPNAHHRLIHNLGHASLAPLVFLAMLVWLVTPDLLPFVSMAMATYAALIVSFLGGVHWGAAWVHEAAGTSHEQDHQTPALWWGVSAPVFGSPRHAVAAITLMAPSSRAQGQEPALTQMTVVAAARISRMLSPL